MDQQLLSSRAVQGMYYSRLELNPGIAWVNGVSNYFPSDQASEMYTFLGQSPMMREFLGGLQAKGLRSDYLEIINKHYEGSLQIETKDLRRDKTGQILARVNEFADKTLAHWASLLSTLILNGETGLCYDGQYFFDTDHSEGDSGTQSNDISVDISALPAKVHGSTTAPSKEEMQQAIMSGIKQIMSFKDDQGEPMNETAMNFAVLVPSSLYLTALAAVDKANNMALETDENPARFTIDVQMNPRLDSWTTKFAIFRTDSATKALIRQEETEPNLETLWVGSEYETLNKKVLATVDSWRNAGYGFWQRACLVTLT